MIEVWLKQQTFIVTSSSIFTVFELRLKLHQYLVPHCPSSHDEIICGCAILPSKDLTDLDCRLNATFDVYNYYEQPLPTSQVRLWDNLNHYRGHNACSKSTVSSSRDIFSSLGRSYRAFCHGHRQNGHHVWASSYHSTTLRVSPIYISG